MIDVYCGCATPRKLPESAAGKRFKCPGCAKIIQIVSGEKLPDGSGAGDFDTALEVAGGPDLGVARLLLGGVADINIGKLGDRQILLNGIKVSRAHCRLQRVDFGPSRWKLIDNKSTNGLFVNGQRVLEHDLQVGDIITVGEYQLRFVSVLPEEEPIVLEEEDAIGAARVSGRPGMSYNALAATDYPYPGADGPLSANAPAPDCPSCGRTLNRGAMICIDCGINLKSGRPVLTSQGVDEDEFNDTAKAWIRLLSFFVWLTPFPIPIRSEAFGTRKPYAIWTIAALTVLTSISFFIYQHTNEFVPPGNEMMLWPPGASDHVKPIKWNRVQEIAEDLSDGQRQRLHERYNDPDQKLSDEEVVTRLLTDINASRGHFHFYQLITHAFLHDTTSILGFIMHLGGNMLFLLVFGTRVNALIGDLATAILYPVLAVASAGAQLLAGGDAALLGASGAIMGLAGMYLILFPAHRVFCAMWIAMWFWFRRLFCFSKIFRVRGFLILLFYFGYDIVANLLSSKSQGGVAHLAHIGGFSTGMVLGFAILFSRLWNTRGGDVLSVTLGKHAWPLIGKPSRWIESQSPLPRAVSLTYR